jgi:hypothetical protein
VQEGVILKAPLLRARTRDDSWRRLKDLSITADADRPAVTWPTL